MDIREADKEYTKSGVGGAFIKTNVAIKVVDIYTSMGIFAEV